MFSSVELKFSSVEYKFSSTERNFLLVLKTISPGAFPHHHAGAYHCLGNSGSGGTGHNIEPLIKIIRGQQVMLDRDLATLYGVETKRLNEQVKRNIKRFPEDFMFQLTKDECLRSQIATLNEGRGQHLKYMPYVFTENGVAMLSSVLRSDTAIEVNIRIMRAFTSMRHFLQNNAEVFQRLSTMEYHQLEMQQHLQESDKRIEEVFRRLDEGSWKSFLFLKIIPTLLLVLYFSD